MDFLARQGENECRELGHVQRRVGDDIGGDGEFVVCGDLGDLKENMKTRCQFGP